MGEERMTINGEEKKMVNERGCGILGLIISNRRMLGVNFSSYTSATICQNDVQYYYKYY